MPQIYIIDKPDLKSKGRKLSEMSITTFIWLLWLWLFLPVINTLLWMVGAQTFYHTLIVDTGYIDFFTLARRMGLTVIVVFIIMRVWGYYNYWRFGRRNKRKNLPDATPAKISEIFRLSPDEIVTLQASKEVTFSFNKEGPVIRRSG
ncbi:MAG: poly-beta-1,6-N-acetyl-D-glucosamine biosynthesis protein PgaD [Deltaproteobacteria bacterium]|nr:poly-beta-1,6-N-acetyl-D-glucosamine biosynthesis protein PgaD [Deltaproteobacteria bacterium]